MNLRLTNMRIQAVLATIFLLIVFSCNTPARLTKKGDALAAMGNDDDAVGYYYTALIKKKNHEPARTSLKISAQKVLDKKFEVFRGQVIMNKTEDAMRQYQNSLVFFNNAAKVNAPLEWPSEYDEIYGEIRQEQIIKWFDEVIVLINQKKFDVAERRIRDLANIDTAYRFVSVLRMNTVLQPLYNDGMRLYNNGKYKQAYTTFSRLAAIDDGFMQVTDMQTRSKQKATHRFAILPAGGKDRMVNERLNQLLGETLRKHEGVFTEIADANKLAPVLASRGWSNITSTSDALNAGKNLGFQYVIRLNITTVKDTLMPRVAERRQAFEAFTENIPNPYTDTYSYITKFKKVEYSDVYESRDMAFDADLELIDCQTGASVLRDNFTVSRSDQSHRFECKCNPNNMYEELPDGNYLPPVNKNWRDQFMGTKQNIMSRDMLRNILLTELSNKVSSKLKNQLK